MIDFNFYDKNVVPEKGDLLISEPFLPDPNFQRTVVLICEHGQEGSFGFVLNKASLLKGCDVLEEAPFFNAPLFLGGPVQQDTLHFIHRQIPEIHGGAKIGDKLHWGGSFEQLLLSMENGSIQFNDLKFFLGYSGWSEGQLEEEIQQDSWIIFKAATAQDIFDTEPDVLWQECLKKMGGKYKILSNYPKDPRLN